MSKERRYPADGEPRIKLAVELAAWAIAIAVLTVCTTVIIQVLRWML